MDFTKIKRAGALTLGTVILIISAVFIGAGFVYEMLLHAFHAGRELATHANGWISKNLY